MVTSLEVTRELGAGMVVLAGLQGVQFTRANTRSMIEKIIQCANMAVPSSGQEEARTIDCL